jgi:hypothetical protein
MCGVPFPILKERFGGFVSCWVVFPLRAKEKMVKK